MKIHKTLILHTLGHFCFGFFLFLWVNFYVAENDPGLIYFFGYFGCLGAFVLIGPLFLSEKVNNEIQSKPYFLGTILILVSNMFIPILSNVFSEKIYELLS
jgi:hypothetical protein